MKAAEPEPLRADYGLLHKFVKKVYAKIFLNDFARPIVVSESLQNVLFWLEYEVV